MKKLTYALLAACSIAAVSTSTFAADLAVADTPVIEAAPGIDWTGLYLGVQAGVANLTGDEDYNDPFYQYNPYATLDGFGATLGAFAGYDIQIGDQFVLGIGGEVNWSNVSSLEFDVDDYHVYEDWQAAIQARAGVLVTPSVLLYALVGYSWAGFDASEYWDTSDYTEAKWTGGGVKLGAGVEAQVADSLFIRAEAAVTQYDTHSVLYENSPYWDITPASASAKLGLAWRF